MNRREFLKSIGYVSAASIVPLSALVDTPQPEPPEVSAKYVKNDQVFWSDLETHTSSVAFQKDFIV